LPTLAKTEVLLTITRLNTTTRNVKYELHVVINKFLYVVEV